MQPLPFTADTLLLRRADESAPGPRDRQSWSVEEMDLRPRGVAEGIVLRSVMMAKLEV